VFFLKILQEVLIETIQHVTKEKQRERETERVLLDKSSLSETLQQVTREGRNSPFPADSRYLTVKLTGDTL